MNRWLAAVTILMGLIGIAYGQPAGTNTSPQSSSLVIGTTPITGGATTQVLFNLGGMVTSDSGLKYAGSGGQLTVPNLIQFGGSNPGVIQSVAFGTIYLRADSVFFPNAAGAGGFFLQPNATTGIATLTDNTGSAFSRLTFGGTTSSYPAIKRNSSALNFRLADDSNDAAITAAGGTFSGALTATLANTATTSAVCYNTGTGLITYDGTIGTCTVSALWHKNLLGILDRVDSPLTVLRPIIYTYKRNDDGIGDDRTHVGLAADDVALMDERCVAYDASGRLSNYEDRCILAYIVNELHRTRTELNETKRRLQ